ncbi:hypothetical protein G6N74_28310 [Mesorhizobium sp. CGMCC 1.15528]|uniref:Helicase C-terminal domain-containing protein n=1 Tax=Mesorhizobium zhangyense TaxID=1776730 RepID=A0A7C9VAY9_9HYPH|nr:hypothetical protein [Mesorhizobium zhangyense]NGN44964.1 hypothetical protein [Mesorhizobium zhangyense]
MKPYTVAQFKNMAGRAGRLGYETQGKAVALADTSFERDAKFRDYVLAPPEPIRSSFDPRNPATWVIRLFAQVRKVPRDGVIDLVCNTFGGFLANLRNPSWAHPCCRPWIAFLTAWSATSWSRMRAECFR